MTTVSVPVTDASQVAEARRRATAVAASLGFDATATGRAAIVATELATNVLKYGVVAGEVVISSFEDDTGSGLELIALDKGPGLSDVAAAMRDGHSTGGSSGTGLGAVRRQSSAFDMASWPERGTAVLARIMAKAPSGDGSSFPRIGGLAVPLKGEIACGDGFASRRDGAAWIVLVADGLGHGPAAAQAADAAICLFHGTRASRPEDILATIHDGLRHTRGGAVSVARYEPERNLLTFAGIGNVAGAVVIDNAVRRTVSLAGTAGHVARKIREFEYPFPPGALLVMCSDGIGTSWGLEPYPGLTKAHPNLLAGVLYRDYGRGRDDATVLVARAAVP